MNDYDCHAAKRRAALAWVSDHAALLAEQDCTVRADSFGNVSAHCFNLAAAEVISSVIGATPDWDGSYVNESGAWPHWTVITSGVEVEVLVCIDGPMPATHVKPLVVTA